MNLSNIVIILDHPDESRNIGSACRAMANNDIKSLRIIGKKENYNIEQIYTLAIHAKDIFDNATFFDSITEATADCVLCAGTTRRRGKKRKGKLLLPEEFAKTSSQITNLSENNNSKIAVVFGNERTGLTDEQLEECNIGVTIPSSDEFSSLNLSHAVQIICYTLFREKNSTVTGYTPLNLKRIDKTVTVISDNLKKIGFFSLNGQKEMELFWRNLLARSALSESEAQYLEKIFSKAAGLSQKKQDSNITD